MKLGINVCFAVKRLTEPEAWAEFVRADLGLDTVQFTFDLIDPWWPEAFRGSLIRRTREAADAWGLTIGTAFVGSAHYVPAGLLDPDPAARSIARQWWRRACDVAGELGATVVGGPLGTLSVREAADPTARARRYVGLLDSIEAITCHAAAAGLREFLIEPTPLAREIPSTITQSLHLLNGLHGRCPIPVGFTLDTGRASAESWITGLGANIRMLQVDGHVDLAPIAASIRAARLGDISAILELRPRFEDDDEKVRRELAASVAYCREHLDQGVTIRIS
ncbi:MAG: Xylose isomerase domain protein barrel [Actinomycetia bacterium]|nr:Xylose isomerase domain protein barrel [Actinomycetes bacterium]